MLGIDAWQYLFTYNATFKQPCDLSFPAEYGVCHTMELPFFFGQPVYVLYCIGAVVAVLSYLTALSVYLQLPFFFGQPVYVLYCIGAVVAVLSYLTAG